MSKIYKLRIPLFILIITCTFLGVHFYFKGELKNYWNIGKENVITNKEYNEDNETPDYVYLSDVVPYSSRVGWGNLTLDKDLNNNKISLVVNGSYVIFDKGIFAHASSTLIYDIRDYKDYAYFTTYYGVNKTSNNNGNGVKFNIYTSLDGSNWELKTGANPPVMMSSYESKYVKIDIKNANYIKLEALDNGNNGNDHSVWADAKIIKEGYSDNVTKTSEEYDELIRSKYNGTIDDELEMLILQRYLVNKVGNYQLKQIYNDSDEVKETFEWLFNDKEMLKLYIMGGNPDGTYYKSFKVLSDLYHMYKDDLNDTGLSYYRKESLSTIYKKMMISLSLTHSQTVSFWINSSNGESYSVNPNVSVATKRYGIYKSMLIRGKLNAYFENLEVEEMRYVMNSFINDDEIEWLRDYIISSGKNWRSAYQFMQYKNVNTGLYRSDQFYGENRANWNSKYKLANYDIANVKYFPKVFMIMEIGGVCWQISNVGQNMVASYGVPSTMIGQPSHVAYLVYGEDSVGDGVWSIWNNVGGWQSGTLAAYTGHKSYYNIRLLNSWGQGSYASNNRASYIILGQAALNDYDNYVKAKELVSLADSYSNDKEMQEQLYREALNIQSFNFDAILGLVNLYTNDKTKTDADYYALAEFVAEKLRYYPLPMYDMLRMIGKKITSPAYQSALTMLEARTLTLAKTATDANVKQSGDCRTMANYLLGSIDTKVADFDFAGEEGATLSLASKFNGTNALWDYSLDGGNTWITVNDGNKVILNEEQIKLININDDILVHIIGVDYSEQNIYKIDIKASGNVPTLYNNDLENRLIGNTDDLEWKLNESDTWTSYIKEEPDLTGNKEITVRVKAQSVYLASDTKTFNFTEDNEELNRHYVSIDNLEIADFSSETNRTNQVELAINAINGTPYSWWHTSRTSTTDQKYIVIKLSSPMYISEIEYIPIQNYYYGILTDGIISTSLDGENFEEVYKINDLTAEPIKSNFKFDKSEYTQYIKLQATHTSQPNGDYNYFLNAAMINIFADLTKTIPTAEVIYDKNLPTASSVTATLVNASEDIIITNNNGSNTKVFDDNGEFIFEFVDKAGNEGSTKAKVDWIKDTSFSLDGDDPYTIIVQNKYKDNEWSYSVDGGNTWITNDTLSHKLTKEEISSLSSDNDVKIKLSENEIVTYDLIDATSIPTTLYANDLENKIIGVTDDMEYHIVGTDEWISFKDDNPNFIGNVTVEVRRRANLLTLTGNEIKTFTFTDKLENDLNHKYISIDHLSVYDFSTENVRPERGEYEYVKNAIDGNINTWWHTSRVATSDERYIIIELDEPKFISQVQYTPKQDYIYGILKSGIISASLDGTNWTDEYNISGLTRDYTTKTFTFKSPAYAKYIKIKCTSSYDPENLNNPNAEYFLNASMISLFEDATDEYKTVVKAIFNTEVITNKDVTAKLVSLNSNITITNNPTDTYTFTDNGTFTFEYIDSFGIIGTYPVTVNWIDKTNPTASIVYSTTKLTDEDVTATLIPSESVTVTNNDGLTYTFKKNGTFTFEYVDKAGNEGSTEARVNWINKEELKVSIEYDISTPTASDVVAKVKSNRPITIDNNEGNDTYTFTENGDFTFEYTDEYGEAGSITAKVTWIDKVAPILSVTYDEENLTNKDVVATLNLEPGIKVINNNKSNTYTFTKNSSFVFEYMDSLGNIGSTKAEVNWIDKVIPTAKIEYSTTELTNQDVIVTLVPSEEVIIMDDGNSLSHTFTENGEYVFKYKDLAGNENENIVIVDWIDKSPLDVKIEYDIKTLTKEHVTAKVVANRPITITNNDGLNTHTFETNGTFKFTYTSIFGEVGEIEANVIWIDNNAPDFEVIYDINTLTNKDVVATLNIEDGYTITNNNGSNKYIFTENNSFVFEYTDLYGNKGSSLAKVTWIDKTNPTATVNFNIKELTYENIIATLEPSENITVINHDSLSYTFTENGEFTFTYKDDAGNIGSTKVVVNWIKVKTNAYIEYDPSKDTTGVVVATIKADKDIIIINGKYSHTFKENGEYTFEYFDEYGDCYHILAKVDWIIKNTKPTTTTTTTKKIEEETKPIITNIQNTTNVLNNNKITTTTTRSTTKLITSTSTPTTIIDEFATTTTTTKYLEITSTNNKKNENKEKKINIIPVIITVASILLVYEIGLLIFKKK